MSDFRPVYVPVGVPTFHLESAGDLFRRSADMLRGINGDVSVPADMLLSIDSVREYLSEQDPDLVIFQNLTFANAAYMQTVLEFTDCPVIIWTLREPVIDGTRLRLNSLTGAYSAANMMRSSGRTDYGYVFGSPEEESVKAKISAFMTAAEIRKEMRSLRVCSFGEQPQGFAFGHADDDELLNVFGVRQISVDIRDIMDLARSYTDEECEEYLQSSYEKTTGLDIIPEKNLRDHARLYKAYSEFICENGIGALASRCWPDFFTEYGTAVCGVLSMLNDDGIPSSCEADMYGALSMWTGMKLSSSPVFFGDPVSLDEDENTLTFWHCGMAPCSIARRDTGAVVGVHPNRKIGPAMDFGCEAFPGATVFRIGREADGTFRFFILEGEILDKPKQFTGTSIVVKADSPVREAVENSVLDGFEPHYVIIKGRHAEALKALAEMSGFKTCIY